MSRMRRAWRRLWGALTLGNLAFVLPVIVLAGTVALALNLQATYRERDDERFLTLVGEAEAELQSRMAAYEQVLIDGAALFAVRDAVSRAEWKRFAEAARVGNSFPGINGLGVIYRVAPGDVPGFEEAARADGFPQFTVKTVGQGPIAPGDRFVITHIEPTAPNFAAVGLDIASERRRREAAIRAQETGLPAMTNQITLVQDEKARPGFLLFVPMYRTGAPRATSSELREALYGWVYAPFVMENFLHGASGRLVPGLSLTVFDGDTADPALAMYGPGDGPFEALHQIRLANHALTLGWRRGSDFVSVTGNDANLVILSAGALLAGALAAVVWTLRTSGQRLHRLVEIRTEDLQRSQARLADAQRMAAIGSWDWDAPTRTLSWSDAFYRILELEPATVPSRRRFMAIVHPDDRERLKRTFETSVETRSAYEVGFRLVMPDGRIKHVQEHSENFYGADGTRLRSAGAVQDVSERRRAAEALRESNETAKALLNAHTDVALLVDTDGRVLAANERVAGADGGRFSESSDGGATLRELLGPGVASRWSEWITNVARTGESLTAIDEHDGTYLEARVYPVKDDEQRVTRLAIYARDITEQRNAEAELQALNARLERATAAALELAESAEASARVKSEFLANMSHEIRTPMNGILGMTRLLADTELDSGQREDVQTILTSAEALLVVINDILDFSKLEAGKMAMEVIDFDLRQVMEDVAALLAPEAHRKGVEFGIVQVEPSTPTLLRGDSGRLRQVLMNLVGNAVKFTEAGEIGLAAEVIEDGPTAARLRISVRDTGVGIPLGRQESVFESFTQADGTSTRRFGGTGLGLTISRQIVQLMGGAIGVESEPGAGSTFWIEVSFPKQDAVAPARRLPQEARESRILVAAENATNRAALCAQLLAWGAAPIQASSADAALELLNARSDIDLVVLDAPVSAPDIDSIVSRFEAAGGFERAKMILCAAVRSRHELGRDPGRFVSVLPKPATQAQLFDALVGVLAGKDPGDARREGAMVRQVRPSTPTPLPLRILVAEDNRVNQKVVIRMLEKWAHTVDSVVSGVEAVRQSAVLRYDVILMDCQMPEMDGFEATVAIRAREAESGGRVPIVALTPNALAGDRERCLTAGMDDYLAKPVEAEQLLAVLQRWGGADATTKLPSALRSPAILDLSRLDEVAGGDDDFKQDLLALVIESAPGMLADLRAAAAAGDASAVRAAAHRLKGSCREIGATAMVATLEQMESRAADGAAEAAAALLEPLASDYRDMMAALGAFAGELNAVSASAA